MIFGKDTPLFIQGILHTSLRASLLGVIPLSTLRVSARRARPWRESDGGPNQRRTLAENRDARVVESHQHAASEFGLSCG
jgi:hypothetical protein